MKRKTGIGSVLVVLCSSLGTREAAAQYAIWSPWCPIPQLSDCQTQAYLNSACGQEHLAYCGELVSAEYLAQRAPLDKSTPMIPPPPISGAGTLKTGARFRYDQSDVQLLHNADATFAGPALPNVTGDLWTSATTFIKPSLHPTTWFAHPAWEANGLVMESCEEYVHEKYYSYSRFEDIARTCGDDHECVYQMAYLPGAPGIAARQLQSRSGVPFLPQIDPWQATYSGGSQLDISSIPPVSAPTMALYKPGGSGEPRNAFFSLQPSFLTADSRYAQNQAKIDAILSTIAATPKAVITDQFAWHAQQHALQPAGITEAERDEIEARLGRYGALVARHHDLEKILQDIESQNNTTQAPLLPTNTCCETSAGPGCATSATQQCVCAFDGYCCSTQWDGYCVQEAQQYCGGCPPTNSCCAVGPGPGCATSATQQCVCAFDGYCCSTQWDGWCVQEAQQYCGGCSAPTSVVMPPALDPDNPYNQIAAIRGQIFDLLVEEWDRGASGCLAQNHACDWSPKRFARRYTGLYQAEREHDYERCLEAVSGSFAAIPLATKSSIPDLEAYFTQQIASYKQQLAEVPRFGKDRDVLGDGIQSSHKFGDPAWFSAGYDLDVGWQIAVIEKQNGRVCRVGGSAWGKLWAGADALGLLHYDLVDTLTQVTLRHDDKIQFHSHLIINNEQVYPPVDEELAIDQEIKTSGRKPLPLFSVSKPIVVVGIPVTLAAWADLDLAYRFEASSKPPSGCNPNNVAFRLTGDFTPKAQVDAHVSAEVGVPGLGGGIKADLNLITAELPVHADTGVITQDQQLFLDFNTNGRLELAELSGKVSLFVEYIIDSSEVELFRWNGYHQSVPLWSFTKAIPLGSVNGLPAFPQYPALTPRLP